MPTVPLELSDYIIDYLHKDARTLASCARVSRSWTPAARFHLFRAIVLQNDKFTSSFKRLLGTSPDLSCYVRELTVAKLVTSQDVFRAVKSSASVERTLRPVLTQLPHLRSLTLAHMELKDTSALTTIKGSLTELNLSYCQFTDFADIVDLVNSFPLLAKLSLSGLTWIEELRAPVIQPLPSLRHLVLGREVDGARLFEWFVAAGIHASLTRLSARCASERDTDLVGPFLKLAGPVLRELELDWSCSGDKIPLSPSPLFPLDHVAAIALPATVSLAECTALESLRLQFPMLYSTRLPWVPSLLKTLSSAPALRALKLEIRLLGDVRALDWAALTSILTQSEACRGLETLDVGVKLWPGVHRNVEEVERIVRTEMGSLEERGVLRFSRI
ncbi:hypothetical protein BV20DRAFT_268149 [Pilatotrama ljubarskyi]|nr:hypothetical protein BV20DRAFT_268149 [Pilatotrama ljubarskyi]